MKNSLVANFGTFTVMLCTQFLLKEEKKITFSLSKDLL